MYKKTYPNQISLRKHRYTKLDIETLILIRMFLSQIAHLDLSSSLVAMN